MHSLAVTTTQKGDFDTRSGPDDSRDRSAFSGAAGARADLGSGLSGLSATSMAGEPRIMRAATPRPPSATYPHRAARHNARSIPTSPSPPIRPIRRRSDIIGDIIDTSTETHERRQIPVLAAAVHPAEISTAHSGPGADLDRRRFGSRAGVRADLSGLSARLWRGHLLRVPLHLAVQCNASASGPCRAMRDQSLRRNGADQSTADSPSAAPPPRLTKPGASKRPASSARRHSYLNHVRL